MKDKARGTATEWKREKERDEEKVWLEKRA